MNATGASILCKIGDSPCESEKLPDSRTSARKPLESGALQRWKMMQRVMREMSTALLLLFPTGYWRNAGMAMVLRRCWRFSAVYISPCCATNFQHSQTWRSSQISSSSLMSPVSVGNHQPKDTDALNLWSFLLTALLLPPSTDEDLAVLFLPLQ